MHKDEVQNIEAVFKKHPDIGLDNIEIKENNINIFFSYQDIKFGMDINNYNNTILRKANIYAFSEIKDITIPPHFLEVDSEHNFYSLCLLEKEQLVLSSYELAELLELYLFQLKKLLTMSKQDIELEFQNEFLYYWNQCKKRGTLLDIYIEDESTPAELELWSKKSNKSEMFTALPESMHLNEQHKPTGTYETALYIPITDISGILPPNGKFNWGEKELLNIICNQFSDKISVSTYNFLKKIKIGSYRKIVIFSFKLKDSITICFSALITFNTNKKDTFISKIQDDFHSIEPISSSRMDLSHLQSRVGMPINLTPPSILVIGVGSVGSYIIPELVNLGITNIGLSDPDTFLSGNALRHYLGPAYDGINKATAMKSVIEKNNPLVNVSIVPNILNMDSEDLKKAISPYDIVIIAVGTSDVQREMNMKFSKTDLKKQFIFNWLDSAGKGCHLLFTNYKSKGCFNCLFYDNEQKRDNNKTSFADGTETLIRNGCCGTFSPYGNNVLLRNSVMVISIIKDIINNKIDKSLLVSIENKFDSFIDSMSIEPIITTDFYDKGCDICGSL